ncbi:PTS sugar transporter subunit IIA [Maridesulfovibrio bastinii]|jgi:PTS system nitrogen regulatory IIA component|uniref:PTS sugar transporter subunit IIA n=1 Tax=Maridesulfovibrio bastinii TaxID=47157 RepID=UPI0003FF7EC3|nr:PTS sugar transporter subunit IIA [Maridesulfovibrio bastinii]
MKIGAFLAKDLVIHELESDSKEGVLKEMVSVLIDSGLDMNPDEAYKVLIDREKLGTTGIGDGIAIPHGKFDSIEDMYVVVGRSEKGIDFDSLDHEPCHIFFLVLAPEQGAGSHLRTLAQISRLVKDDAFRKAFMQTESKDDLWKVLQSV